MTTQGIEAGTGETARLDGEATKARSASADAPDHPTATDWQNRSERAEAECKELRERVAVLEDTLKLSAENMEDALVRIYVALGWVND